LSFVFCLLSFVFCLLSFVFCLLSFVFCLSHYQFASRLSDEGRDAPILLISNPYGVLQITEPRPATAGRAHDRRELYRLPITDYRLPITDYPIPFLLLSLVSPNHRNIPVHSRVIKGYRCCIPE
jgi:hypothetical protein